MDSFAQTGAQQDDLFNDFANGEESMQTRAQDDLFGDEFTPITEPEPVQPPPASKQDVTANRGRGGPARGRGRGRGRGDSHAPSPTQTQTVTSHPSKPAFNPLGESRHAPNPLGDSRLAPSPKPTPAPATQVNAEDPAQDQTQPEAQATPQAEPPAGAPTEPRQTKAAAVRGDRSGTGGSARTKLTEEELANRMNAIRLKNASLEAAHARAQADADSFAQRENEAAKKRQVERRDRQQMMGEREKNRQRKLKAQEGREWDQDKQEDDFADRRRGYGRGAHGGIAGTTLGRGGRSSGYDGPEDDGRQYIYREDRGRGQGRGGKGGRGDARSQQLKPLTTPQAEDFPALATKNGSGEKKLEDADVKPQLTFPSKQKDMQESQTKDGAGDLANKTETLEDGRGKQSWADMVEDSRT